MSGCWVKVRELHQAFLNNHPVLSVLNPISKTHGKKRGEGVKKDMICCDGIKA